MRPNRSRVCITNTLPQSANAGNKHQLVYLMDGKGRIKLNNKDYDVNTGAGIYLDPSEIASIEASGGALKLFVLVVPKIPK